MRTPVLCCLALAYVLALPGVSSADDDARALVARAVKALGGEELLARRAAVHARVKGSAGGAGAPGLTVTGEAWLQPGSQRMELVYKLTDQEITVRQSWHAGKGWRDLGGDVQDLAAEEIEYFKQGEYVQRVLDLASLLKDKDITLKALGKTKVDGAELLGLKVSSAGRQDVTLYFDPATGYPKRAEYRRKVPGLGKEMAQVMTFDDYREVEPAAAEERALKAAGVGTDGAALVEFLRGQVRGEADREKVKRLVKELGDDAFDVREKATAELIRLGPVALSELRRAAGDADAEVASRAGRCLEKIAAAGGPHGLLSAALRVAALRRPAGTAEVLLELAPSLTDEDGARDLREALAAVARRDGRPDPAVEKALADRDPARRAAAAAALGKDGGAFEKQAGRRLFLTGLKRSMKTTYSGDGEPQMVLEMSDVRLYNRFDDKVFAKPK